MRQDEGNSGTEDGSADELSVPKRRAAANDSRPPFILDSRLAAVSTGEWLFAVVVEAEVGDKVFAHDVGAGDEIHQRRKILVAP
jgi:hypothetical protein